MFGQTGNSSFGFNSPSQNSPFGQSAFSKTIANTNFGTSTPPVFGSNTSLFNTKSTGSTTGLFGNSTSTPTFGTSTSSQSFGGFSNTNANTALFGAQQNANTNLFGSSTATSTFGQANKPTSFGFGQSSGSNLFGQPQQQNVQQTMPFGQITTSPNSGLFGNTSGFGTSSSTSNISGTTVKFNPVTGTDTMVKNGVTQTISTRHHCITCMKEYEYKSLEELRLEDYSAGRKGTIQGQPSSIFGATSQSTPFGTVAPNSSNTNSGFGVLSSGFGTSNNTGLFSKPVSGFGTPATTSSTFAFNSTNSSNLFNAQTKPFGSTSTTPLFASNSTTSTPGNAFGNINTTTPGFGNTFNNGQSNQNIGLFPHNKTTFSLPSTSTSFGFGQSSTANNNLFNSKPVTTGFGTAFGSTTSTAFQSNNAGFGSSQNASTALFNNSFKPSVQSSGFSFGNTSNSTSVGSGSSVTSLFSTTTKPNIFSNTNTPTTFNTPATFGSIPPFGSISNSVPLLGTNTFGSGSSINSSQNNHGTIPVHQQILALVSTPFGDSPLLKNLLPASGKSDEFLKHSSSISKELGSLHHKVLSSDKTTRIKPKLITPTPLSKKSLFDGLDEENPLVEAFQPRPNAKRLVLRPKSIILNEPNESNTIIEKCNFISTDKEHQASDKENDLKDDCKSSNSRRSSNSWLKSNFSRIDTNFEEKCQSQLSTSSKSQNQPVSVVNLENTISELRSSSDLEKKNFFTNVNTAKDTRESDLLMDKSSLDSKEQDSALVINSSEMIYSDKQFIESNNKANIRLSRHGYYTLPDLDELDKYVIDKTCIVPHFTVGRKGYGNVYFPDSFDVYGLDLDEIVHFRHKEVIIYPDDNTKPPIGKGLNRKAQVTLDRVWPHDKSNHEPITNPKRLIEIDYEGKLRRVSAKHETRFLEYRPETGSWVFKVDHFSKYGLSDSDDEETVENENQEQKKFKITELQKSCEKSLNRQVLVKNMHTTVSYFSALDNNDEETDKLQLLQKNRESQTVQENNSNCSSSAIHAHIAGTKAHTLQLMKASFFEFHDEKLFEDQSERVEKSLDQAERIFKFGIQSEFQRKETDDSLNELALLSNRNLLNNTKSKHKSRISTELLKSFKKEIKILTPKFQPKIVLPMYKSFIAVNYFDVTRYNLKCIADIGLQKGKEFKHKWAPQSTLLLLRFSRNANTCFNSKISRLNTFTNIEKDNFRDSAFTYNKLYQNAQSLARDELENGNEYFPTFKQSIEGHLDIQLKNSKIKFVEENPFISVVPIPTSKNALRAHTMLSFQITHSAEVDPLSVYFSNVWKLSESLWGSLNTSFSDQHIYNLEMHRKEALSEWFKEILTEVVNCEIQSLEQNDQIILSLLSAHNLEEACNKALESGDHCLALLLSQLDGTCTIRELIKQQIALWQTAEVDHNFSTHRLKLFMLIAGVQIISKENEILNVCENLDWKRAFAIYLWYLSSSTASITDVLELYDSSFGKEKKNYAPAPKPEYIENNYQTEINTNQVMRDLCYHLIKLYCIGNYPLEAVLNPETHTKDIFDYRMSWMLQQTLISLGYIHVSDHVATLVHSSFAAQLESYDLWHWSIFVVLHLRDDYQRKKAVMDLLLRHVKLNTTKNYKEKEDFLVKKLKISQKWINEAKAIRSCTFKRYEEAVWYYIVANKWNEAHEVIMEHIATDALINGDHDYLRSLFNLLLSTNCSSTICGWAHQGQLILDYITITTEINKLIEKKPDANLTYNLELLKPQLISLCTKINMFPDHTSKHRLCQAEMSKRTLQLTKGLLLLLSKKENDSNFFVEFISQLPLPEDYAQQELRLLINIF